MSGAWEIEPAWFRKAYKNKLGDSCSVEVGYQ